MVSKNISDAYRRLVKQRELYIKATRWGNFISLLGIIIFLLSTIPIIPIILVALFKIDVLYSILGGFFFGFMLIQVGEKINRKVGISKLSPEEKEFLKIFKVLENIETYQKQKIEFTRFEAEKLLSKFDKNLIEPSGSSYSLWRGLTKETNENLRLFKRNLNEILIPNITQGDEKDMKKACFVLEKFAKYLLNPTVPGLEGLNNTISGLKLFPKEKAQVIPFFERYPILPHILVLLLNGFSGFLAFYVGINIVHISTEIAYLAGTALFGTLTAGYIAITGKKVRTTVTK